MTQSVSESVDLQSLFAGMDVAAPHVTIDGISTNSRDVAAGGLFLACAGAEHHGLDFVSQALTRGARAVAWEPAAGVDVAALSVDVPIFPVPGLSARLGVIADRFFNAPSATLNVTGVTGTNGKTTVAYIVNQALNRLDVTSGYMGTLGYGIGGQLAPSALTTPGCVEVHARLREMLDGGAQNVVAEVSSHALDQGRVDGVRFDVVALTNLSQDHLDYHGSMERYAQAKARLFVGAEIQTAVVNVGDRFGASLVGKLPAGVDVVSVALVDTSPSTADARLVGRLTAVDAKGIGLSFHGDFGEAALSSPLWGRFNGENLVVAVGILLGLGNSLSTAVDALTECFAPPGRMERIARSGEREKRPSVIVDFAHTPDALAKVLGAVRDHCVGELWCVFGCGGDRDRSKRGAMGTIVAEHADHAIVTDDNPREEDSADIIAAIVDGIPQHSDVHVLPDRAGAIKFAIDSAAPQDAVLIAGKGHESVQVYGTRARPFSDAAVAGAALEARS